MRGREMRINLDGLHRAGVEISTETAAENGGTDWQHLLLTFFPYICVTRRMHTLLAPSILSGMPLDDVRS